MAWDSQQYLKFARERRQPCMDLIHRLQGDFSSILDLGCGPGNSTKALQEAYLHAHVVGFDADENMLKRARADCPELSFVQGFAPEDLDQLGERFDLVFSNACIHWIQKQKQLIQKVHGLLRENGVFAAQLPLTNESPFYQMLDRLVRSQWTSLQSVQNFHNLDPTGYYNTLRSHFHSVELWKTEYYHVVKKEMVLEWYRGSGLRPYLALLSEEEQSHFLRDLQGEIDREYHPLADGNVFLIMPRLFFLAKGPLEQEATPEQAAAAETLS